MKLTITANIENGAELATILAQVTAQYTDGVGSYCLPAETVFGLDTTGKRVSRRSPDATSIIEFN